MRSTTDVLKNLGLNKTTLNLEIAKNYSAILSLIVEIAPDATFIEVCNFEKLEYDEFYRDKCKIYDRELHKVFNLSSLITLKITTNYGSYSFTMPTDTDYYSYVSVLLKIGSKKIEAPQELVVENVIYVDNKISTAICNAKKFTIKDNCDPLINSLILCFSKNKVEVLSTNRTAIYKSQEFNYVSDKEIESFTLPIGYNDFEALKMAKNEFLKIEIIDGKNVLINSNKIDFVDYNFQQLENFNFATEGKMEFLKSKMQNSIKGLKPLMSCKKTLNFHLNGSVNITALNIDAGNIATVNFDYESKNFKDLDFEISYDDLNKALIVLKSKKLNLLPSSKFNVITNDSNDKVLLSNMTK